MISAVIFLGNPGRQHENTRHNLPWMLLKSWAGGETEGFRAKFKGRHGMVDGIRVLVPETFMNKSGLSVQAFLSFFSIKPDAVLVVHDDTELPFGTVNLRLGGGLGGHNGLRSVKQALGTDRFRRYRLGVGRPRRGDLASHVLGRFDPEEEIVLPTYLEGAARILREVVRGEDSAYSDTKIALVAP